MKEVTVEEYLYDEYGDRCGEVEVSSYFVNDETTIKEIVDVFAPSEFVESVEYCDDDDHFATIVADGTEYEICICEISMEPIKPQPYFTREMIEKKLEEERWWADRCRNKTRLGYYNEKIKKYEAYLSKVN